METSEQITKLAFQISSEMSEIADYVWKSPRLLEHETKIELQKVSDMKAVGSERTAAMRWSFEHKKLSETFPHLIAVANLYMSVSACENHILSLLTLLRMRQSPPTAARSAGLIQHLGACREFGMKPEDSPYYQQVLSIVEIRNCLMHANGFLDASKKRANIEAIVRERKYVDGDLKRYWKENGISPSENIWIATDVDGVRLDIDNMFSYHSCYFLREFSIGLCKQITPIPKLNSRRVLPNATKKLRN